MFKNQSEFSLHIESIKIQQNIETYTETLTWFYENETDHEMEEIVKMLNQKIIDNIRYEAETRGLLKETKVQVRLF